MLPCSNLRCCRSLARLHLRSQQPAAFQLSSFATGSCSIGTLGLAARQNKSFNLFFSDGTADPNQCFRLPSSFEGFRFETQARAIQDISRSRVREFTLFRNSRKRNTLGNCEFPVQNKYGLWRWVEKELSSCNLHIQWCETIVWNLASCPVGWAECLLREWRHALSNFKVFSRNGFVRFSEQELPKHSRTRGTGHDDHSFLNSSATSAETWGK